MAQLQSLRDSTMPTHGISTMRWGRGVAALDKALLISRASGLCLLALVAFASAAASNDATAVERSLWLHDGRLTPQAVQMIEVLRKADEYGLSPADYPVGLSQSQLRALLAANADPAGAIRFDAAFTASVSRFVAHLQRGRVSPAAAGFHFSAAHGGSDPADAIRQLAVAADVRATLATFEPRPQPYRLLKRALAQYRNLSARPALNQLAPLPRRSVALGDAYEGAQALRTLLVATDDLEANLAAMHGGETRIDSHLDAAVRRFQERHGLQPDGVIGPRTYAALTVPFAQRVRQIELALERWRWLAALPRPDIVVNIPQFMLYALPRPDRPQQDLLEMPVIVGRSYTRTPVFVAAITQVVFHPFWDVPSSIVRKELLPAIRKDPAYLQRHHFEIVRGAGDDARVVEPTAAALDALAAGRLRLRQRPGPDNALGPVKFVLPNAYEIRLHGTPERALFARADRAFSHGCVRVSDPAALAEYVLGNAPGRWDAAAVDAALCGTQTLRVTLTNPVRVVVFYVTAAATESRGVLFSNDVYGHDRRLDELLRHTAGPVTSE